MNDCFENDYQQSSDIEIKSFTEPPAESKDKVDFSLHLLKLVSHDVLKQNF